jgi:hypothetical protein
MVRPRPQTPIVHRYGSGSPGTLPCSQLVTTSNSHPYKSGPRGATLQQGRCRWGGGSIRVGPAGGGVKQICLIKRVYMIFFLYRIDCTIFALLRDFFIDHWHHRLCGINGV